MAHSGDDDIAQAIKLLEAKCSSEFNDDVKPLYGAARRFVTAMARQAVRLKASVLQKAREQTGIRTMRRYKNRAATAEIAPPVVEDPKPKPQKEPELKAARCY